MKKLFICLLISFVMMLMMASCIEEFRGNYGIVENVELVHSSNRQHNYLVTVYHKSGNMQRYKVYTNEVWHPGDTIMMCKKGEMLKEEIYELDTLQ